MRANVRRGAARGSRAAAGGASAATPARVRVIVSFVAVLLAVQVLFLFVSQSDMLAAHGHREGGGGSHHDTAVSRTGGRRALFGEGISRPGVAAQVLDALRPGRRGAAGGGDDVFVDDSGMVPVAVKRESGGGGLRQAAAAPKAVSDPANPQAAVVVSESPSPSTPARAAAPAAAAPARAAAAPAAAAAAAGAAPVGPDHSSAGVGLPPALVPGPAAIPPELASWTPPWPRLTDSPNAYITLVSGNSAARHAIAWIQSLIEVKTKYPIIVLLGRGGVGSPECINATWRAARGIQTEDMRCDRGDTTAPEIVSQRYLDIMTRQGALLQVVDEIPRTRYTETIAGGRHFSWGMSLNKLQIFNMTHYKKLVFMDSDTIAFKNLDHLFGPEYPMFTAAMTYSCCNKVAAPTVSGGMWVVEPALGWGLKLWQMMATGKPQYHRNGTLMFNASTGAVVTDEWYLSDLDLVRAAFGVWEHSLSLEAVWPMVHDLRHGYVPGLRLLPQYAGFTDEQFSAAVMDRWGRRLTREGFLADTPLWDGKAPVFRALDLRYDQCVGHCECLPERDLKQDYISVHFSCIPEIIHKAAWYETEAHFMEDMWLVAESCTRYYFVEWYYRLLVAAGARLDPPYWDGPPVPIWNATHDEFVRANKEDYRKRGIARKY
jgi:hypothetical protein